MKDYRIYDMYDYFGINLCKDTRIAECSTLEEARRAAANYDRDCDGECDIYICKRNPEANGFLAIEAEPLKYDVEVDY